MAIVMFLALDLKNVHVLDLVTPISLGIISIPYTTYEQSMTTVGQAQGKLCKNNGNIAHDLGL